MNRIIIVCLCVMAFAACKKDDSTLKQAAAQAIVDDKIVTDYIATNNLNAVRVKIGTNLPDTCGVWYVIGSAGSGVSLYTSSTTVTVGYTGKQLTTGTLFQSTSNYHPSFVFGQMIRGWQLGIPNIKKGGSIRLLVTSRYAYGPYPQPLLGLPANAVLDFNIELFDVLN